MTGGYSIGEETREGTTIFRLEEQGGLVAEVVPAWGDNCVSLRRAAGEDPILEPVDFEVLRRKPSSYGIPILFPFPNRIREGRFRFRGRDYAVDPRIHGFVRDKAWEVVGSGASPAEGAWIRAQLDARSHPEKILAQFPFPFVIEITHRLRGGALGIEAEIRNAGTEAMPFGFGLHPYFRRQAGARLCVPAELRWELAENLPTGRRLAVEGGYDFRQTKEIGDLALDDAFTGLGATDGLCRCTLDAPTGDGVAVSFDRMQFPELVVYTAPAPRRAVAIEPYTCPPDAFNLHERGLVEDSIVLKARGTRRLAVAVSPVFECPPSASA